jgi:hypothetical protein
MFLGGLYLDTKIGHGNQRSFLSENHTLVIQREKTGVFISSFCKQLNPKKTQNKEGRERK